jgi:ankyrin repeat protein
MMKEFFDAIKSNDLGEVSRLITGAKDVVMFVNQACNTRWTPLLIASEKGHAEVAQLLLEHGADVNQAQVDGWTPLLIASDEGHAEVAQLLLAADGIKVNQVAGDGWTPLFIAAENGHAEVAELLLAADGIKVNQVVGDGWTPLLIASEKGHAEVAELLLEHDADVNQAKNNGCTPLTIASEKGHAEVAQLLLEHGADVNQAQEDGWTPLLIASEKGYAEVAELLLEHCADVNQAQVDGWRPLSIASRNRNNNIVVLLNACSADEEQRERAFRVVDLSGQKAIIYRYINMNQHFIAARLFKSLKPEDRIKLIRAIAPGVNEQYRNLQEFSLICKKFFNAAALNKANICHARDGFSLFQDKKFNDIDNSSFKLPDDMLYYMSQFFFVASEYQEKEIRMIERLWRWHNTVDTPAVVPGEDGAGARLTPGMNSMRLKSCIIV